MEVVVYMVMAVVEMGTIVFLPTMKTHSPTVVPQLVRVPLRKGKHVGPMKDIMDLVDLPVVVLIMVKMLMKSALAGHLNAAVELGVG